MDKEKEIAEWLRIRQGAWSDESLLEFVKEKFPYHSKQSITEAIKNAEHNTVKLQLPEYGQRVAHVAAEICKSLEDDAVSHPAHYTDGKIEVIDFILDKKLNFCRGNAVKYIARAGKKDPAKEVEDLEKAIWYLNCEVARLKEGEENGH